jgi:CBS domain-containing protein
MADVEITVKDAMTKGVLTVKPNNTIKEAAQKMSKTDIDSLVVMDGKDVVGIITVGDIGKKVVSAAKDVNTITVQEVMSHPIRTIEPDQPINEASKVMRDLKIKHLPVVRNGKLIGMIAESDLIRMDPGIYEILKEKIALEQQQLVTSPELRFSGECDECANYSDVLKNKDDRLLCEECFEEETEEA